MNPGYLLAAMLSAAAPQRAPALAPRNGVSINLIGLRDLVNGNVTFDLNYTRTLSGPFAVHVNPFFTLGPVFQGGTDLGLRLHFTAPAQEGAWVGTRVGWSVSRGAPQTPGLGLGPPNLIGVSAQFQAGYTLFLRRDADTAPGPALLLEAGASAGFGYGNFGPFAAYGFRLNIGVGF